MRAKLFQFIQKHPFVSFFIGMSAMLFLFLFALFVFQEPLLRERNLKALVSMATPAEYKLLVSENGQMRFQPQNLGDSRVRDYNKSLNDKPSYKFVLMSSVSANALLIHSQQKSGLYTIWLGAGFDNNMMDVVAKALPKEAAMPNYFIIPDYFWDSSWGVRYLRPKQVLAAPRTLKRLASVDAGFWDKFPLPDNVTRLKKVKKIEMPAADGKSIPMEIHPVYGGRTDQALMVYLPEPGLLYLGHLLQPYTIPQFDTANGGRLGKTIRFLKELRKDEKFEKTKLFIPAYGPALRKAGFNAYLEYLQKLRKTIKNAAQSRTDGSVESRAAAIVNAIDWEMEFPGKPEPDNARLETVLSVLLDGQDD